MPALAPIVRPPRLRRSWLLANGLDAGAQQAGLASGADVLVADLARIPSGPHWQEACGLVAALVRLCRLRGTVAAIRVGALAKDGLADLRAALRAGPDAILLAHAEHAGQVAALDQAIGACESAWGLPAGRTEIVPELASARGIGLATAILGASPRISAALLHAANLSAEAGAADGCERQALRHRFMLDCAAAGCLPIDCAFPARQPAQAHATDLQWARGIGLTSRHAAHAQQIGAIHAAFTPDAGEVRSARALVAAYAAQQRGDGHAGAPIGPPDYLAARRLLARHAEFQNWNLATPGLPPVLPIPS